MAAPLLKLQMALQEPSVAVGEMSEAIRSDIGLAAQFLQVAVRELRDLPGELPRFEELVVHVGVDKIRRLAAQSTILMQQPGSSTDLRACERAWKRARLTALAAEYLAARTGAVDSDKAYLAGLFHHLGYCVRSLNRISGQEKVTDPHELGYRLARSWNFPSLLLESMRKRKPATPASTSDLLREIVKTSAEWVLDVELQGIADAEYAQSLEGVTSASDRHKN